jgi:hypothetical protein
LYRKDYWILILTGQVLVTFAAVALLNPDCNKKIHIVVAGLFFYIAALLSIYLIPSYDASTDKEKKIIHTFKLLKHDFQNHLQVLYSLIQLKKYNNAIDYINRINSTTKIINQIFNNITDCQAICYLLQLAHNLKQKSIGFDIIISGKSGNLIKYDYIQKELQKYLVQFDQVQGEKELKMVFNDSEIELDSNILEKKVIHCKNSSL